MRKFIIISLLSAMTLPTLACIWGERTNPYLFSLYRQTEFRELAQNTCDNNWQAYLGTSEDYFWFNADEILHVKEAIEKKRSNLKNAIITYHLDKDNINRYKPETYEKIYHH